MEATTGRGSANRFSVLAAALAVVAAVAAAVLIATVGGSRPATAAAPADPVVYAAGDIACEPGSSTTATKCREANTSNLILNGGASKALALGDLQYNTASISNLRNSYDKSWGRVKSITTPVIGNHESTANGYFDYFYGSGRQQRPLRPERKGLLQLQPGRLARDRSELELLARALQRRLGAGEVAARGSRREPQDLHARLLAPPALQLGP